jgi:hypothetical protein
VTRPGPESIFGAHSNRETATLENSCASLQAESGATCEGRIHNHEQLHMTIFLSDAAWPGNQIFCGCYSAQSNALKILPR